MQLVNSWFGVVAKKSARAIKIVRRKLFDSKVNVKVIEDNKERYLYLKLRLPNKEI